MSYFEYMCFQVLSMVPNLIWLYRAIIAVANEVWLRCYLAQFMSLFSFYASLKTSENQRFSDVFRGIEKDQLHEIG